MQQTAMPVEQYRQYQGSYEELLLELTKQGVSLSVVGENSLHIKGEVTQTQKEKVHLWKSGLIELLSPLTANEKLAASFQSAPLTDRLNQMIGPGASFDVSADDFQIFGADNLQDAEKEFLRINKPEILCTLQQGLLVKYLFFQKPEIRETFVSKIKERGATFEAVNEITAKWFIRLLDTMPETKNKR